MFTFCPLQGARSEATASQSLLELDGGVKVLVDVGWDEGFDGESLRALERQIPTISLVLLTHATVSHMAAFAHCCKHYPQFARIPVYATKPVIDLGRTLLQDLYASTVLAAATIPRASLAEVAYSYEQSHAAEHSRFLLPAPTADEITRYFALIRELKYSQPHQPQGAPNLPPLTGLTITAYNAGRTLGGTLWHVQHGLESIVYGVDWGQFKENVFAGAAWIGGVGAGSSEVIEQLRKPTALVSSSRTPAAQRPGDRDRHLLDTVRACVVRGGTVLIPVDSTARILELAYLLEHAWRSEAASAATVGGADNPANLSRSRLYLAGRNSGSLVRHARTLLEWMNDSIVQEFEAVADTGKNGGNTRGGNDDRKESGPFDLRYVRLLERKAQVDRVLDRPAARGGGKVILASDASLEWGFSKEVLRRIADNPANMVILTEVPGTLAADRAPSLARTLWEWWREADSTSSTNNTEHVAVGEGRTLAFQDARREALAGTELDLYQQWLATQRQLQSVTQTAGGGGDGLVGGTGDAFGGPLGLAGAADDESDSSDSDESDGEQGRLLNVSTTIGQASRKKVVVRDEDLGVTILIKRPGHYDYDVRHKKGRERLFPVPVRRRRDDVYGELIRPEEYLRAEEREEEAREADEAARKRKFDEAGEKRESNKRRNKGSDDEMDRNEYKTEYRGARDSDDDMYEEDNKDNETATATATAPAKLILTHETVPCWLRIAYVDYSGLHTARNLEILLPLIEPRKLILVGGSDAETAAVASTYRAAVAAKRGLPEKDVDVLLPRVGDAPVDASVDTHAWAVKIADALARKLQWQNLRGLGIVTMTGQLHRGLTPDELAAREALDAAARPKTDSVLATHRAIVPASAASSATLPTLDVLPASAGLTGARLGAQPLHVGELRLADLRRGLLAAGHAAEFRGEGTLVVDGSVAVRKTTTGRVEVESIGLPGASNRAGGGGGTFYAVKKMIYAGLAVVAGG